MKKFRLITFFSFAALLFISFASCQKNIINPEHEGETSESSANSAESHNNGLNCMNCHKQGGPGEGIFTVAGSIYKSDKTTPATGGTIRLYTQPNGQGTLVATLQVDQKGNFYTTSSVNFGNGLYPTATNSAGNTMYMGIAITTGQCNSCHGVSQDKIWNN